MHSVYYVIWCNYHAWKKVGTSSDLGCTDILFKSCSDLDLSIKASHNWWVWKFNQEQKWVGDEAPDCNEAEIGMGSLC